MVALKPRNLPEPEPGSPQKQERRGGIETNTSRPWIFFGSRGSRNAVVALKQDRLGGGRAAPHEAGTPWWH